MVDCKHYHSKRNKKQQKDWTRARMKWQGNTDSYVLPAWHQACDDVMMSSNQLGQPSFYGLGICSPHNLPFDLTFFLPAAFHIAQISEFWGLFIHLGFNLTASCVTFSRTFCRDPTTTTHTTHCLFLDTQKKNTDLEST